MVERLPMNKAPPKRVATESNFDRLRKLWAEATEIEKAMFKVFLEQEQK